MKIVIFTENIREEDKQFLLILSGHKCKEKEEDTNTEGTKIKIDTPRHKKEAIILLLDQLGSMEPIEISRRLEISEATVRSQLVRLMKEKITDRTLGRPAKYFLRKKGDDELAEALKNVKTRG